MTTLADRIVALAQSIAAQIKLTNANKHNKNARIDMDATTAEVQPWIAFLPNGKSIYPYINKNFMGLYHSQNGGIWTYDIANNVLSIFGGVPYTTNNFNPATKANLSGARFSGDVQRDGSAGYERTFSVLTDGKYRWVWGAESTPETGSNAGSKFYLNAFSDNNNYLFTAITIDRKSQNFDLYGNVYINGYRAVNDDRHANTEWQYGRRQTFVAGLGTPNVSSHETGPLRSTYSASISDRINAGFFQSPVSSTALGWPTDGDSWMHLISATHDTTTNYFAMQIACSFFQNENFFIRSTNNSGNQPWRRIITNYDVTRIELDIFRLGSDAVRMRLLGWNGDETGSGLRLSSKYADINAAKQVFPNAQSLTEYINACAVERVIQLNETYYGRSSLDIPAGATRFNRGLNTTGKELFIRGKGSATQFIVEGPITWLTHGIGARFATGSDPQNRPVQLTQFRLSVEGAPAGTRALDISYFEDAGIFFQTKVIDVDIDKFGLPIRLRNPGRGLQFQRVAIFGPDFTCQPNAAIEIILDSWSKKYSAQANFTSVRIANYRWGWDVEQIAPFDSYGQTGGDARRSMEGFIFHDCGAYNGWGMVRGNCDQAGYSALLWEFRGCDWQGAGHAFWFRKANQIIIEGGFWIGNADAPAGDTSDPAQEKDPITGQNERRYMTFLECDDVKIKDTRLDVSPGFPYLTLIHTDTACRNTKLIDNIVRAYSEAMNCGFRLMGAGYNTIFETGTTWTVWGNPSWRDPASPGYNPSYAAYYDQRRVVDMFGCQASLTNAMPSRLGQYGRSWATVDETGLYTVRCHSPGLPTNANGDIRFEWPRRPPVATLNNGEAVPFFLAHEGNPSVTVTAGHNSAALPALTVKYADKYGVTVTFGPAWANNYVELIIDAQGR